MPLSDFPAVTHRFELPFLFVGQAQREGYLNEALARIDALLHLAIEGKRSVPPDTPQEGQCWLIDADPEQDWVGKEGQIAIFTAGNWLFVEPQAGMTLFDRAEQQQARFTTSWHYVAAPVLPTGGSVVDTEARTAIIELVSTLRQAGLLRLE